MKNINLLVKLSLIGLIALAMSPSVVQAAELTARSATVSNSAGGATGVSYSVAFSLAASQTLGSVKFEICDSPLVTVACAGTGDSAGASFGAASLGSMSLGAGWSVGSSSGASAGGTELVLTHTPASLSGGAVAVINGIVNPTAPNKAYYLRVSTYTDGSATAPAYPGTDYGSIALATSQQITVTGTMPESLVFCVGTTWNTDCTDIAGSAVNLGTFSPTATSSGTSVMAASTNAGTGYAITIHGTTMTSGLNTIPAMGTQTLNSPVTAASVTGTSQFGTNLRLNTVPAVGANASGAGSGGVIGGYNVPNGYRFFNGDIVASAAVPTNQNLFTNSYIVNVGGSQAAGLYSATMTYICTATF